MRFFRIFLSLNLFDTPFLLITKLIGSYLTSSNIDSVTEKRDFMHAYFFLTVASVVEANCNTSNWNGLPVNSCFSL